MANQASTIELIFKGIDQASTVAQQTAKNIGDALGDLDGKAQSIASPFANLADGLLTAEAAVLALGAALGVAVVNETVKFQDSLGSVAKQLGDSSVTIEQARTDIEGLALQYGINANLVAESLAGFLAAGHDYATAAGLVTTATQLMIAGDLDAQTATDALNKSLAGFRVPAGEAAEGAQKVGDILNKIGDISSGKFEEIVQGFSRISPTAKDAGLSMEETASAIAVLVDVFGSGEIAATALKSGLLSLLTPSTEAQASLDRLGVSLTDSNGVLRTSKDIITDLAGKWGTLTDAQKQQTAAIIFGKDQAGAMSALLGDWGKQQDYVTQLLDKTTGAVGSMAREVENKLSLLSTAIDISNESWRQFLENLGAKITDGGELQGLIENTGKLGQAFKEVVSSGGLDPLLDAFKGEAAEFSTLIGTIAENLPEAFAGLDWSGLVDALQGLKDAVGTVFKAFFDEIDLTTVEGLTRALQTVVNTFETLIRVVTGIVSEFEPFAAAIGETIRHFNDLDDASKLEFGQTLGGMKLLVDAGTGLGLALIAIGRAGIDMSEVLDTSFGVVKATVNGLQVAFDAVVLKFYELKKAWLEGKIRDEDTPWGSPDKLTEYQAKLKDVDAMIAAVTANLDKNAAEFDQGAAAIGGTSSKLGEMNGKLDAAEAGLKKLGSAAKDAGQGFSTLQGEVTDAIQGVEETIKGLETIDIKLPKFEPLEPPDLDFEFSAKDLGIGNPFEVATDGLEAFRAAAEGFGMDGFSDSVRKAREAAEAEGKRMQTALEQAITGGNAGGYKVEFNDEGFASITANAETLKTGFQQLDGQLRTTKDGFKYVEDAAGPASTAMTLLADGTLVAGEVVEKAGRSFSQLGPAFQGASAEMSALEKAQKTLGEAFGKSGADVGLITSAFSGYMNALGKSGSLTTDQFINLTKTVNDFKSKMEEIASNERLKTIEFGVQLETEKLKADVERVKAAFASIDSTIQSTGDLLGSLFGNLTDTDNRWKELEIQEQIDQENRRRQEALDLQKRLTEAEIARIEAQTEALNRGDALIRIEANGLEPELEAFMWKILTRIRTRANAEFADYLLGLGV